MYQNLLFWIFKCDWRTFDRNHCVDFVLSHAVSFFEIKLVRQGLEVKSRCNLIDDQPLKKLFSMFINAAVVFFSGHGSKWCIGKTAMKSFWNSASAEPIGAIRKAGSCPCCELPACIIIIAWWLAAIEPIIGPTFGAAAPGPPIMCEDAPGDTPDPIIMLLVPLDPGAFIMEYWPADTVDIVRPSPEQTSSLAVDRSPWCPAPDIDPGALPMPMPVGGSTSVVNVKGPCLRRRSRNRKSTQPIKTNAIMMVHRLRMTKKLNFGCIGRSPQLRSKRISKRPILTICSSSARHRDRKQGSAGTH